MSKRRSSLLLSPAYHAIVITAMHTGLRQGELLRLTWADIGWNVGVMTVQEPKADERQRIPMNSVAVGLLSRLNEERVPAPLDAVFHHDARYLRRAFDRAVKRAGLTPFRFHDLRHTFASRLAIQGANDRTLMALGRWEVPGDAEPLCSPLTNSSVGSRGRPDEEWNRDHG